MRSRFGSHLIRIRSLFRAAAASAFLVAGFPGAGHFAPAIATPSASPRPTSDVSPPLEVQLSALDPLTPGHVARFRLTVIPHVPTEEIRIEARPDAHLEWTSGARSARLAAHRDLPTEHRFAVRVPRDARRSLYLRVEVTAGDGTVWRRGAGLGLGPNPRSDRARVVPDGHGGQAIEYEAAPANRTGQ